ncbi:uncharacterized protein K441DRAFT_535822 [Cenococcum geophilum 1.58]|uniref:uncharacterized protein n=1 Tax=Cenococcum geophilum 1.58 TaxID=794803 RepID=UPI00358DFACC|nr:hypothetical protein K441DRAFT_535822 [Cenococcum geophilum 1.58]
MKVGLLFFIMLSVIFGFAYYFKEPSISECVSKTNIWSPANAVVEYEDFDFDNDFAHKTKYRGPPTPELERAWEDLWYYNGVRFPEDRLPLINRTHDLGGGRKPRKAVDGKGGYHAAIDVFHQLHCLNLIRQYTWIDYYRTHSRIVSTPLPFKDSEIGIRMHLDHCIETLRLTLMCHGDTTPLLVIDDPELPIGVGADFSSHHKCRNFEVLRKWTKGNQIQPTVPNTHEPEV